MKLIEKLRKRENITFPNGKIMLLDGRELDCHLLDKARRVDHNSIEFDTTGVYLTIGNRKKKRIKEDDAVRSKRLSLQNVFIDNALFLYENRERIFSDSRMFLAPVAIENAIAYTGTSGFRNPTVGVYLEWWCNCEGAIFTGENGLRHLVYHLAGSPLTGVNRCTAISEDGTRERVTLRPFNDYWLTFVKINQIYSEAKSKYEAYTLEQTIDILRNT